MMQKAQEIGNAAQGGNGRISTTIRGCMRMNGSERVLRGRKVGWRMPRVATKETALLG
jgi:hypothetical protein